MRVRLSLVAGALLCLGLLAGCGQNDSDQKPSKPTPPPVVSTKPAVRVELMPDASDEYLRRHFTNANGIEVETQIEYRNGDKADIKYRADGSQLSLNRVAQDGTVVADETFAADGKTIVSGRELRDDKTLKWTASQDASGVATVVTYWWDGKTVFSQTVAQPGGAYETTYFRKDGSVWVKRFGAKSGTVDREQQFDKSGTLTMTLENTPTDMVATLYRADGSVQYKQHMVEVKSGYGNYVYRTMGSVEEYATDGKTLVRRIVMDSGGYSVAYIERPQADGTTLVRTIGTNGVVTHEVHRDASGNTISQRDITPADGVKEPYEWRVVRTPSIDDPVSDWTMAEKYPYYRR